MRRFHISTAPSAMEALVAPTRRVTICGPGASALGQQFAARIASERSIVTYICGDNHFDPYVVARHASQSGQRRAGQRRAGQRREEVLTRILVARAFTCFQLSELIERLSSGEICGPVIVSGICTSFMDEDLSCQEAARLFYRTLWRLVRLADSGLALLFCENSKSRGYFLGDLCRVSDFILHLDGDPGYELEMRNYRPLISRQELAQLE